MSKMKRIMKNSRFAAVLLTIVLIFNMLPCFAAEDIESRDGELFAYVFAPKGSLPQHIYSPYKMSYSDLKSKGTKIMAKEAAMVINAMPEGRRCLDLNLVSQALPEDSENRLWWDKGAAKLNVLLDELFGEMKKNGVILDYVIDDFEGGMSNWVFDGKLDAALAVENDPRYKTEIRPLLEEYGFTFTEDKETELYNIVHYGNHPTAYLIWNGIMGRRTVDYYNSAIYEPLKKHYSDTKLSNYGMMATSGEYKIYDLAGHKIYLGGETKNAGTHSSPELYGMLVHLTYEGRAPEGYPFSQFKKNGYNTFLYLMTHAASTVLGTDGGRFMPWIPLKNWKTSGINNNYYDELIFHLGLMNPDPFLLFNVNEGGNGGESADEQYLSRLLGELNSIVKTEMRKTLVDDVTDWDQRYILTGMELENKNIWRITPDLYTPGITLENFLSDSKNMIFQIGNQVVDFPDGSEILELDSMSDYGYWITTPKGTKPIELRVDGIETPPEPVTDENNNPAGYTVEKTYAKYNPNTVVVTPEKGTENEKNNFEPTVDTSSISGHWAQKPLNKALADGLIIGSDKGLEPDREVTKAEFITMVMRAIGLENDQGLGPQWYSYAANKAVENGWTADLSDIEDNLCRAAAAEIIANAMQLDKSSVGVSFTDDDAINSTGYLGAVKACSAQDIINGYPDGSFRPFNTITRAEAVVIIQRAYY